LDFLNDGRHPLFGMATLALIAMTTIAIDKSQTRTRHKRASGALSRCHNRSLVGVVSVFFIIETQYQSKLRDEEIT